MLIAYYSVPIDRRFRDWTEIAVAALFVAGIAGLVWLVVHHVREFVRAPERTATRLVGLLAVVYIVVAFFALTYYLIETWSPGEFEGLETRTDALYYTFVTLGTVGFGDVHAVGQMARVVTMVQVTFDLVVIGLLFAVASASVADRVTAARAHRRDDGD